MKIRYHRKLAKFRAKVVSPWRNAVSFIYNEHWELRALVKAFENVHKEVSVHHFWELEKAREKRLYLELCTRVWCLAFWHVSRGWLCLFPFWGWRSWGDLLWLVWKGGLGLDFAKLGEMREGSEGTIRAKRLVLWKCEKDYLWEEKWQSNEAVIILNDQWITYRNTFKDDSRKLEA